MSATAPFAAGGAQPGTPVCQLAGVRLFVSSVQDAPRMNEQFLAEPIALDVIGSKAY